MKTEILTIKRFILILILFDDRIEIVYTSFGIPLLYINVG